MAVSHQDFIEGPIGAELEQKTAFLGGNECAAQAAKDINFHVMGYYPITPSTEIAQNLDEKFADGEHTITMIPADGEHGAAGICYGASIGGIGTLIGTPPNGVFVGQLSRTYGNLAPEVSFSQWMMAGIPLVMIMIPLAWLIVTNVSPSRKLHHFTFGLGGGAVIDEELKKLGPMQPGE